MFPERNDYPNAGLNRRERRQLKRDSKRIDRKVSAVSFPPLASIEQALEHEDDSGYLKAELGTQRISLKQFGIIDKVYRVFRLVGASEKSMVALLFDQEIPLEQSLARFRADISPHKINRYRKEFGDAVKALGSITNLPLEDEYDDMVNQLTMGISPDEIIAEILRQKQETIGLLQMQIEWLNAQNNPPDQPSLSNTREANTLKQEVAEELELQSSPAAQPPENNDLLSASEPTGKFPLADWHLQYTNRFWSTEPHHLVDVDTSSREKLTAEIARLADGHITINPRIVARDLEFHLGKDVIQRALSARLAYALGGRKDWIKIKRRRDRIGLLVPIPSDQSGIFFVGGRDEVYKRR